MDKPDFSFHGYHFESATLDFANVSNKLDVRIDPSGEFVSKEKTFYLKFNFIVLSESGQEIVRVVCKSEFVFDVISKLEDVPQYFYVNSIAIVFPYVRAFVSNMTLQANYKPILLPTMNLSSLNEELKNNTVSR